MNDFADSLVGFIIVMAILVVFLNILLIKKYKDWRAGKLGEKRVKKLIDKTEPGKKYVYNNLIFMFEGKVSQIDHIVMNKYGIFVIETKHWSGFVYGKDLDKNWTLVKKGKKKKVTITNPVKQNNGHIYKLSKILNLDKTYFHNMVVFLRAAEIKKVKSDYVYTTDNFRNYLKADREYLRIDQLQDIDREINQYIAQHGISQKEFDKYYKNKNNQ